MNAFIQTPFGWFGEKTKAEGPRKYLNVITIERNGKGVIDVDTVKGCTLGMKARPGGGCYGECYPAIMTTDPKSKFETPKLFELLNDIHRGMADPPPKPKRYDEATQEEA